MTVPSPNAHDTERAYAQGRKDAADIAASLGYGAVARAILAGGDPEKLDSSGLAPKGRQTMDFAEWWLRSGQYIDPDTSDVPWCDKRKALAESAFAAANAMSGNYVADTHAEPHQVTFANGRVVASDGVLRIGWELTGQACK